MRKEESALGGSAFREVKNVARFQESLRIGLGFGSREVKINIKI